MCVCGWRFRVAVLGGALVAVLLTSVACGGRDPFASTARDLERALAPAPAEPVPIALSRGPDGSRTATWQFTAGDGADAYAHWLESAPVAGFRVEQLGVQRYLFSRTTAGDRYAAQVSISQADRAARVQVELRAGPF